MGLLEFLNKNKDARKIFGERELKIIEKQMFGVNLTQSEKNRLSRDIRKKFEFIKEVGRFSDEFDLKKGNVIKQIVEETKNIILQSKYFPRIKRISLFGSSVENKRTFRSDIDIAVEFDEITEKEASEFRIKILGQSKELADVQVYNVLPKKIKSEIDLKGKVIYEQQNRR